MSARSDIRELRNETDYHKIRLNAHARTSRGLSKRIEALENQPRVMMGIDYAKPEKKYVIATRSIRPGSKVIFKNLPLSFSEKAAREYAQRENEDYPMLVHWIEEELL